MRARTLLLLAVAMTVVPILAWSVAGKRVAGAPAHLVSEPVSAAPRSPQAAAVAVLRRWDGRRAAAWSTGDPAALARLYARGSRTGAHDVADLRRWIRRGLRVTGLRQQVASVVLTHRARLRLVVVVTDRTVDGVAVGSGRRTAVPASAWASHRIFLRLVRGTWRVVEVAQPAR